MNDAHSNVNSTSGRLRRGNERLNILFDSLRKNSFEAKCACISPLTPSSERGIAQCIEWGMREDREWMGELETEYLSVRRRRRPRPLRGRANSRNSFRGGVPTPELEL